MKDAVLAIDRALNSLSYPCVYYIGMGANHSIYELALKINRVFENEGNITFKNNHHKERFEGLMDINKAKDILEFSPSWNLEAALYDMK